MEPTKGKVWITNDMNQFDFSAATQFGKLTAVTTGSVNVFNISTLCREIDMVLKEFDPESDYLLLTGHGLLQWACIESILSRKGVDEVKTLVFGSMTKNYVVVPCREFFIPATSRAQEEEESSPPRKRRGKYRDAATPKATHTWAE